MRSALGAGAGDVAWSLGFLARHALVILPLSAVPAAQRVFAALHPDDARAYAWPVEVLVAAVRVGTLVVVFRLGRAEDAAAGGVARGDAAALVRAVGAYVRDNPTRALAGAAVAGAVLVALNALAGPVAQGLAGAVSDDERVARAWTFGVRNLVIIPAFYAVAYGLVRPAGWASA